MVTILAETDPTLDRTLHALSDPTRRAILARLTEGEATVGELAAPFEITRPAISKHLRVLEGAHLVRRTREGRVSRCVLDPTPLKDVADWVGRYQRFWEQQLDGLARYLERTAPTAAEEEG
ncbi:MAG: metalloregulator ArsR/SmtB family transcription factor [Gemmatimonadota bacterium]